MLKISLIIERKPREVVRPLYINYVDDIIAAGWFQTNRKKRRGKSK